MGLDASSGLRDADPWGRCQGPGDIIPPPSDFELQLAELAHDAAASPSASITRKLLRAAQIR